MLRKLKWQTPRQIIYYKGCARPTNIWGYFELAAGTRQFPQNCYGKGVDTAFSLQNKNIQNKLIYNILSK